MEVPRHLLVIFLLTLFALFFHTGFGFIPVTRFKLAFEVTVKTFNTFSLSRALLGMPAHFFSLILFSIYKNIALFPTAPPMGQQGTVAAPRANEPKWPQLPLGNRETFRFKSLCL